MKAHSAPKEFNIDKFSYLDFIFNCTDYKYDRKSAEAIQKQLWKIISPRLSKDEISEVYFLLEGIAYEAELCLLKAVASLDCVTVELTK